MVLISGALKLSVSLRILRKAAIPRVPLALALISYSVPSRRSIWMSATPFGLDRIAGDHVTPPSVLLDMKWPRLPIGSDGNVPPPNPLAVMYSTSLASAAIHWRSELVNASGFATPYVRPPSVDFDTATFARLISE